MFCRHTMLSVPFKMIGKMSSIRHLTVWKCHENTDINNVFKRNNYKKVPAWMTQGNDVTHRSPKHFMLFADVLIGSWQWQNYSTAGDPGINWCLKEHFNLAIIDRRTFLLSVCYCKCVSSWHPFVQSGMKDSSSNLKSCKVLNRQ